MVSLQKELLLGYVRPNLNLKCVQFYLCFLNHKFVLPNFQMFEHLEQIQLLIFYARVH